jgi:hypothetical protein
VSAIAQVDRNVMSGIEHVLNRTAVDQSSTFQSTAKDLATLVHATGIRCPQSLALAVFAFCMLLSISSYAYLNALDSSFTQADITLE